MQPGPGVESCGRRYPLNRQSLALQFMITNQLHSPVGEVDGVRVSTGSLLNGDVVCRHRGCRGESSLQRSKQGHGFSKETQHGEVFEIQRSLSRGAFERKKLLLH